MGELAVLDAQVLQLVEMLEAPVVEPRPVAHQLGAVYGEGHGALGGNHGEVCLVKLRVDRPG